MKYRNALQAVTLISMVLIAAACTKSIALPNDLSCGYTSYPSSWETGALIFDFNGSPSAGVGATVLMTKSGRFMTGSKKTENTDLIFETTGGVNADGISFSNVETVRLHPISSGGSLQYLVDLTSNHDKPAHVFCIGHADAHAATAAQIAPQVPVGPHIKTGGYICDKSYGVMGERQLRDRGVQVNFQGCQEVGADVQVNVLGRDPQVGAIKVGNSGGVAWVDEQDLVGR